MTTSPTASVLTGQTAPAAWIGTRRVESTIRLPVIDPYREIEIGTVGVADADLVDAVVTEAGRSLAAWSATAPATRADILDRTADLLEQRGAEIAATVSAEMGMPITLAAATQRDLPVSVLRSMAAATRAFAWSENIDGAVLHRVPAGIVAAITPWNMPVHQIVAKVAAALAAGCTVVLKPAEATPFDAELIRSCFIDAGVPAQGFAIVNGDGPTTGAALSAHPGLAHVSFTGSVRGGQAVARAAAGALTRTTLELGGKSPAVVLADADLATVIPKVFGSGLVNSGQACNATTRLILPAAHAGRIEELLVAAAGAARLGDPADPSTTHGPLASRIQTDRVLEHIATARESGARFVIGTGETEPSRGSDCFIAPIVLADLPPDAAAVREEIFGPVLVIQYYDDEAQAITLANDCQYGLSAEVWSGSTDHARAVAGELEVGQVKVNGVRTRMRPAVPFGGLKRSGYGRELGAVGLAEFTEIKAVMS